MSPSEPGTGTPSPPADTLLALLAAKWDHEQATYPPNAEGWAASAAVRLCARELRAALSARVPCGHVTRLVGGASAVCVEPSGHTMPHRDEKGTAWEPAVSAQGADTPTDELAEAELWARDAMSRTVPIPLAVLLAEYDRRGAETNRLREELLRYDLAAFADQRAEVDRLRAQRDAVLALADELDQYRDLSPALRGIADRIRAALGATTDTEDD